jgi:formate--tetrahydrofolate ligase
MPAANVSAIAAGIGIDPGHLIHFGTDKAKVSLEKLKNRQQRGKLILVSAITPTPAGEGKTTISVGLAQGLKKIRKSDPLTPRPRTTSRLNSTPPPSKAIS